MRTVKTIYISAFCSLALAGCGDINVSQPGRPVIIEEKKDHPVIVEKTIVEKPVIVEKTTTEKPAIIIDKK
jgi:hypothetical protein